LRGTSPPQKNASRIDVAFRENGDRSVITLTHSGWGAFGDNWRSSRETYDSDWVMVFTKAFAAACAYKTGKA